MDFQDFAEAFRRRTEERMQQFEREVIKAQRDITAAHKQHKAPEASALHPRTPNRQNPNVQQNGRPMDVGQRRPMRGIVQSKTLGQAP